MGYKKIVSLACDGPCGAFLENQAHAPEKWNLLSIVEKTGPMLSGQKGPRPLKGYFCPSCTAKLMALLSRSGYALEGGKPESESAKENT